MKPPLWLEIVFISKISKHHVFLLNQYEHKHGSDRISCVMEILFFKKMVTERLKTDPCFWAAVSPAVVRDAEQAHTDLQGRIWRSHCWPHYLLQELIGGISGSFLCLTSAVRCLCSKLVQGKLRLLIPVTVGICTVAVDKLRSSVLLHS